MKSEIHPRKILLTICWDQTGIIQLEPILSNVAMNAVLYCELYTLVADITDKRPARPHSVTLQRYKPHKQNPANVVGPLTSNLL